MIYVQVNKNSRELIDEIIAEYPDSKYFEIDSFDLDSIINIIVPVTALLVPVATQLIQKLLKDNNVTIKYNGYEISGDYDNVQKMIKDIQKEKSTKEHADG